MKVSTFFGLSDAQRVLLADIESQAQIYTDMGVVTTRNATDLNTFQQDFINAIAQHRHWMREN
jgi:catalase